MRFLTGMVLLLTSGWWLGGAPAGKLPPLASVVSQSGQFLVQGPPEITPSPGYLNKPESTNYIRLNQARLAVLAERVKQAVLRELAANDQWRGRVVVNLYRAGDLGEPVFVKAQYMPGGWFYRVDIPSEIEPPRLVRLLVAVLMQEMADRTAGAQPAELPFWLERGLAAQVETLYASSFAVGFDSLMQDSAVVRIERKVDPMVIIRRRLQGEMPLDFDGLNWPKEQHFNENAGGYYETCAHLLVLSLLRLPEGPACLRRMVQERAARNLNWQTSFLEAFGMHFKSLRDADKWWNLQVATFSGRDLAHTYSLEESWRKLEEILECPVIKRPASGKIERQVVSLQAVIGQWEYARQKLVVQQKLGQLQMLRIRVSPQVLRLTEDYLDALQYYLNRRRQSAFASDSKSLMTDDPKTLARRAVARLNQLDILRSELKAALREEARTTSTNAVVLPK
jgi:hypothetical protein